MKYDGNTEVKDNLFQFEILANFNGWNEEERGMESATSLIGDAREVLSALPGTYQRNYGHLRTELLNQYSPPGREERYAVEL
jgi:hypothetical protein